MILDSPPVLQNPSSHGVTVTWAVRTLATGWVEYGPTPQLGRRADNVTFGQRQVSERFLRVRLEGLEPGQPLYYRIVAAPVEFGSGSKVECGEAERSEVYHWMPFNENADTASFAVINDTHQKEELLAKLMERLAAQPADMTIWNGDVFSSIESEEEIAEQILRPAGATYAASQPVLFVPGNHDYRGRFARRLSQAVSPWDENMPAGKCFAVRQGPLAVIGLDTSEDKPDRHPIFSGLTMHEEYREQQQKWLKDALLRPEIANAPYLVAFCHIPLWGLPDDNPGDILEGYAGYCRQAQQLWHPLLEEAGAQLLITGHKHRTRYDAPTAERSYAQIVGGGPTPEQATIIRGRADKTQLEVSVHNLEGTELGNWKLQPRHSN